MDESVVKYSLASLTFGAVLLPFCLNYPLRETMTIPGMLNKRAIVGSVNSDLYVDDYLDLFGGEDIYDEDIGLLRKGDL